MAWSIYKDTAGDVANWQECHTAWFVDHDVDTNYFPNKIKFLHDGEVDVYYGTDYVTCKVEGGQWASDTERKILDMVSKTYWGVYVEGFARRQGTIEVIMGS